MSVKLEVWGPYACFTRPELKTERVTYDVITPSAARGIIEAIYWHPGMQYHIDKIYVLSKPKYTNIRRNEVKSVASADTILKSAKAGTIPRSIYTPQDIQQRAALILQDVHYVIEAHFTLTDKATESDNAGKFQDILKRRINKGQCYHQPYFGCREFPVSFKEAAGEIKPVEWTEDLGFMLYDIDYSDKTDLKPQYFRAKVVNGVMDIQNSEVYS